VFEELNILLSQKESRKLFVGIGNVLKMDDGVGVYLSRRIKTKGNISSLTVEASIENYIGKINSLNPDILILIDCLDMKEAVGTFKLLSLSKIQDLTFNTHMQVYVLGIQPEKINFGENISYIVKNVADRIIKQINKQEVYHGCRISL